MSSFFTIVLIAISLSMDAFSLAIAYGITGISDNKKIQLSLIVGMYHFIMPLIGLLIANVISNIKFINLNYVSSLILMYIGIDLIISSIKDDDEININNYNYLIFGLSVSLDSLSIGIGLKAITNSYIISSTIFSLFSFTFTYIGLLIGNIIGKKIGTYSKIIGGLILTIIAIIIFVK